MKIIHGNDFRMHLILENSIFENVLKDLQKRFEKVFIVDEKPLFVNEGKIFWDPGGSVTGNDVKFCFKMTDEISLECRAQHWDAFKKTVSRASKDDRGGYFKLHSHMFILCLTEEHMIKLLAQVVKHFARLEQIATLPYTSPKSIISGNN